MDRSRSALFALSVATGLATLALAAVHVAVGTPQAEAQTPPARYYGVWGAGELVEAYANDKLCGATETDANGTWVLEISTNSPCAPSTGDVVTFKRQGELVAGSELWSAGDVPDTPHSGSTATWQRRQRSSQASAGRAARSRSSALRFRSRPARAMGSRCSTRWRAGVRSTRCGSRAMGRGSGSSWARLRSSTPASARWRRTRRSCSSAQRADAAGGGVLTGSSLVFA